ncbi:MAG TPA: fumarylacetoacetate hydrolase family protein [Solirubrobacteraceae bacterium]|nr:fumarylacetoacetate hydrolase family protein [Solirubrobacteraceae bacterium]
MDAEATAGEAGVAPGDWRSVRGILARPSEHVHAVAEAATKSAENGEGWDARDVRLGPPVPDPEKIICVGLNYPAHTLEIAAAAPAAPSLFAKFPPSLIGHREAIVLPAMSREIDWEGELAVVIGRTCKFVPVAGAMDVVAGGMAFNDVSARDLQMETSQWTAGKALDTFAPCGPALVSLDELGEIQSLALCTRVNGELVQDSCTAEMTFSVAEIVSFVSNLMTLRPGDIIATGTPDGVGFRRTPPRFLAAGDVVEVELEGIGAIANPVLAADAAAPPAAPGAEAPPAPDAAVGNGAPPRGTTEVHAP